MTDTAQKAKEYWEEHPYTFLKKSLDLGEKDSFVIWNYFRNIDHKAMTGMPWAHTGYPPLSRVLNYGELKGKNVLDLAVGAGWTTEALCRASAIVTATDFSPYAVALTKKRLAFYGLSATVVEADMERLPFPDGSFDYVLAWGCLMHVPDLARATSEIRRVLRPGGKASGTIGNKNSLYWRYYVWFKHGILGGEFLRRSAEELTNRYTEGEKNGGCPLTRFHTRVEACRAFAQFDRLHIRAYDSASVINYFPHKKLPLGKFLPAATKEWVARNWGQTLWFEAVK
ncbi:MAG: class I SAM-dependent methyltransferase [Patescibacteria group bacterium]